jgi:hypothetical protein
MSTKILLCVGGVAACAYSLMGASFQNGSFELGSVPSHGGETLAAGSTAITGWVVLPSNIDWIDFVGNAHGL